MKLCRTVGKDPLTNSQIEAPGADVSVVFSANEDTASLTSVG